MISIQNNKNMESLDSHVSNINYYITRYLNDIKEYKDTLIDSLTWTESYVKDLASSKVSQKSLKIYNNLVIINNLLYNYFNNFKVETLDDLDNFLADLTTLHQLMRQHRYGFNSISDFFRKSSSRYNYGEAKYCLSTQSTYDSELDMALEGTDRFIKFIKNRYSI